MSHPTPADCRDDSLNNVLEYYLLKLTEDECVQTHRVPAIIRRASASAERSPGPLEVGQERVRSVAQNLTHRGLITQSSSGLCLTEKGGKRLEQYRAIQKIDSPKDNVAETLLDWMGPPLGHQRVLDVGTGRGYLAFMIADEGYDVLGIDPEIGENFQGWLSEAREKARQHTGQVHFERAALKDITDMNEHFDYVVSSHAMHHMDDKAAALRRANKVLKPAGTFISLDLDISAEGFIQHGWHCFSALARPQFEEYLTACGFKNMRCHQEAGYLVVAAEKRRQEKDQHSSDSPKAGRSP